MLHRMKLSLGSALLVLCAVSSSSSYALSHQEWTQFTHITDDFEAWTDLLVNTRVKKSYKAFIADLQNILTSLKTLAHNPCTTADTALNKAFKNMLKDLHTELEKVYNVLARPGNKNAWFLGAELKQKCLSLETMVKKIDQHITTLIKLAETKKLSFTKDIKQFKQTKIASLTKKQASHSSSACIMGLGHLLSNR